MPTGSKGVGKASVTSPINMREELDIHSAFTWEKFLREGVDSHFNARKDVVGTHSLALASDFWTQTSYSSPFAGRVRCPIGVSVACIYSKRAFKYPILSVRTQFPTLDATLWQLAMFGLENGAAVGSNLAMFRANPSPDLTCVAGGDFDSDAVTVLNVAPANWLIAQNVYTIYVQKHLIEFSINSALVGLAIPIIGTSLTNIASPPYNIFFPNNTFSPICTSLIELTGVGQQLDFDISPFNYRIADGDPIPPRIYKLYQTGTSTLIAGTAIAAGSITSHPFPLIGYGVKTIFFRANTAGTLSVQVLTQTGNWREYESLPVLANTLLPYVMEGTALVGRVQFTPSAFPSTPSDAEVVLQPWQ